MDPTPNGLKPEWTEPQMDSTMNGFNLEWTQLQTGQLSLYIREQKEVSWRQIWRIGQVLDDLEPPGPHPVVTTAAV
jgi:hypothetical protein